MSTERQKADPRVSFLVVNYNMRLLVEECLDQLADHMRGAGVRYEVLLGDNSTEPDQRIAQGFAERRTPVRLLDCGSGTGWVPALNRLVPKARGEFVCIMHPDIAFEPGCVAECVAYLRAHPEVDVAAPNPMRSDGKPAMARRHFPSVRSDATRLLNLVIYAACRQRPFVAEPVWDRRSDGRVDSVLSFCFFCRREVLADAFPVGGGLRTYYANDAVCMAARRRGQRVMYLKGPTIRHYERRTPRRYYGGSDDMEYKGSTVKGTPGVLRDRMRFIRAFYPWPVVPLFRALTIAEFGLHSVLAFFARDREEGRLRRSAYWTVICDALKT